MIVQLPGDNHHTSRPDDVRFLHFSFRYFGFSQFIFALASKIKETQNIKEKKKKERQEFYQLKAVRET